MQVEENKALIRQFVEEFFHKANQAAFDQFVSTNLVDHNPPFGGPKGDFEGTKKAFVMLRTTLPDLDVTVEDMIGEGDKVVARWISRGTHQSEFLGVPPTGKQVLIPAIHIFRIDNGKIVEQWGQVDMLSALQQLGVIAPQK